MAKPSFPFGVKAPQTFVVLDKSFLQAMNSAQLQYYVQMGWIFGLTETLMHEHFRKRDPRRIANLFKLHSIEGGVILLPGIGEMFRSEAKTLKPASKTMLARSVKFTPQKGPTGGYFELDGTSRNSTEQRNRDLKVKLNDLIDVWQSSLREIPAIKNASSNELPGIIKQLSLEIRDDRESMRAFYANHRHAEHPPPELLDEEWTFFRWIQVQLLAGLDFIRRYGEDEVLLTDLVRRPTRQ